MGLLFCVILMLVLWCSSVMVFGVCECLMLVCEIIVVWGNVFDRGCLLCEVVIIVGFSLFIGVLVVCVLFCV